MLENVYHTSKKLLNSADGTSCVLYKDNDPKHWGRISRQHLQMQILLKVRDALKDLQQSTSTNILRRKESKYY